MSVWQRFNRSRRNGTLRMALTNRLRSRGIYCYAFYLESEIYDPTQSLEPVLDSYEVKRLSLAELEGLDESSGMRVGPNGYQHEKRIADGCQCLGIISEGRIVAFTWAEIHTCSPTGFSFELESNEAYLFDAFTERAYRGKKIAPFLRHEMYRHLAEQGRTRLYSVTTAFNTPSLRFKSKLGSRHLELHLVIGLGKRRRIILLKNYGSGTPRSRMRLGTD